MRIGGCFDDLYNFSDFSTPGIIGITTPDMESHCDIHSACYLQAPSISECGSVFDAPINGNPPTPKLFEAGNTMNDPLNSTASSFVPESVTRTISNDGILEDSDENSPQIILQNLRLKNVDKIIIAHININSLRNKIDLLADVIKGRVDILLVSETKLDASFPSSQFFIPGFSDPLRLDRTANGGGLLLYYRNDIPAKPLPIIYGNIECIIQEFVVSKKKWILLGIYNPNKSQITNFLSILEKVLLTIYLTVTMS